jgi:hypothetical protein
MVLLFYRKTRDAPSFFIAIFSAEQSRSVLFHKDCYHFHSRVNMTCPGTPVYAGFSLLVYHKSVSATTDFHAAARHELMILLGCRPNAQGRDAKRGERQ